MPQFWNDIMDIPEARWIVYGTVLIFAVLIAVYVSLFFRNMAVGAKEGEDLDLLSEFRNLRDQGHLDENEFNRLKTVVPDDAKHELLRGVASGNGESKAQEKNFITLAEAEALKKTAAESGGNHEDSRTEEE